MKKPAGITVRRIGTASPLYAAGVRRGDRIVAINGDPVLDELDARFYLAAAEFSVAFVRNGAGRAVRVVRQPGSYLDIEFNQAPVRRCAEPMHFLASLTRCRRACARSSI